MALWAGVLIWAPALLFYVAASPRPVALDRHCALGGNDQAVGLGGNNVIRGGASKDRLTDKAGTDRLFGEGARTGS